MDVDNEQRGEHSSSLDDSQPRDRLALKDSYSIKGIPGASLNGFPFWLFWIGG